MIDPVKCEHGLGLPKTIQFFLHSFERSSRDSSNQGAPKAREKKRPLHAVSGNINHRVPR